MRSISKTCCGLLVAAFMMACGGSSEEGEDLPEVDCSGTVPTFSEVTALEVCVNCHAADATDRQDAPAGVNFDTYAAASAEADEAAEEVNKGSMPPSPYQLTAAEKQTLYKWALCGTPQ